MDNQGSSKEDLLIDFDDMLPQVPATLEEPGAQTTWSSSGVLHPFTYGDATHRSGSEAVVKPSLIDLAGLVISSLSTPDARAMGNLMDFDTPPRHDTPLAGLHAPPRDDSRAPERHIDRADFVAKKPPSFPTYVPPIREVWTAQRGATTIAAEARSHRAIFIATQDHEATGDVLKAVLKDLQQRHPEVNVRLRGTSDGMDKHYLEITASSRDEATSALEAARLLAGTMNYESSVGTLGIYVQAPDCDSFDIVPLAKERDNSVIRPHVVPHKNAVVGAKRTTVQCDQLCHMLRVALGKLGRAHSQDDLAVHFGQYVLVKFPHRQRWDLDAFIRMTHHGRFKGMLMTRMENLDQAMKILAVMKHDDSPFNTTDFTAVSKADIKPEHVLEVHTKVHTLDAILERSIDKGRPMAIHVAQLRSYGRSKGERGELDVNVVCLGEGLDWKIETADRGQRADTFRLLTEYLESGTITLAEVEDAAGHLYENPRVALDARHSMAARLELVAIRSVYAFRYGTSAYTLRLTIHREWNSISAMSAGEEASASYYSMAVSADSWKGDVSQSSPRRDWGHELENLLDSHDTSGAAATNGDTRVQSFVATVNAIRRAVDVT